MKLTAYNTTTEAPAKKFIKTNTPSFPRVAFELEKKGRGMYWVTVQTDDQIDMNLIMALGRIQAEADVRTKYENL